MEYTAFDVEEQDAQLLPEREALGVFDWANVTGTNLALALNAGSLSSVATAVATQGISVVQS
jgi:hypothetical protein